MDHDHELLREEIVHASRTEPRGPIPEFVAKNRAEQAPGTAARYDVVLAIFERFCKQQGVQTVGHIVESVAHDFITAERERGMSARTIHDRVHRALLHQVHRPREPREAERLVRAHVLREKEDIFYLTFEELQEVVRTRHVDDRSSASARMRSCRIKC